MKNQSKDTMYGIRKGIAFYFNDYIEKDSIKTMIGNLINITGTKFTSKRAQDDPKIRLIRGGWKRVFDNTFRNSTFEDSNVLMFTDGTKEALPTTKIYMNLWNPNKMPSIILINCMTDIEWDTIISFIHNINELLNLQFVSAGYDVVSNDFWYPGSAAYSLKFLQTMKYANSKWTEWFNPSYRLVANDGICCPNIIQFLSHKLWSPVKDAVNQSRFHCEQLNSGVLLDVLDHRDRMLFEPEKDVLFDRLSKLYQALRPIIIPINKPMFLKENEWASWQKRYDSGK